MKTVIAKRGWNKSFKCWHFEDTENVIPLLIETFRGKAVVDTTLLNDESPVDRPVNT